MLSYRGDWMSDYCSHANEVAQVIITLIILIMIPNNRFRKTLLLLGGSSELGRVITKRFAKTLLYRWNVFNVDSVANPEAQKNFVLTED
jgi:hypothetical protein